MWISCRIRVELIAQKARALGTPNQFQIKQNLLEIEVGAKLKILLNRKNVKECKIDCKKADKRHQKFRKKAKNLFSSWATATCTQPRSGLEAASSRKKEAMVRLVLRCVTNFTQCSVGVRSTRDFLELSWSQYYSWWPQAFTIEDYFRIKIARMEICIQ